MERIKNYIVDSLEQHLFFARIMKEHAFFLTVGLLPPNRDLAREGERLLRQFEGLLSRAIALSNCAVRGRVLTSGEVFTEFTLCAESQTQRFTGIWFDRRSTAKAMQLNGLGCAEELCASQAFVRQVQRLNQDGIILLGRIIHYKERLLRDVNSCRLFTASYPLLIEHILREARLYRAHLLRLENRGDCACQELCDSELFWNRIMMEHAMFIRGLLDPGEEALLHAADGFTADYKRLLDACAVSNDKMIRDGQARMLTQKFRDFKQAGVEGIEACKIRSIILPLLADHVLREANHYLRLLED